MPKTSDKFTPFLQLIITTCSFFGKPIEKSSSIPIKSEMNTQDETLTISIKETLLPVQQTSQAPKLNKNLIPIIFSLLTVLIFFGGSMILTVKHKSRTPERSNSYGLSLYYCHLTRYPNLCYTSISSILNLTAFQSNPNLIFSASIQVAINQLQDSTVSIKRSLSLSTNKSRPESCLRECKSWVKESLSQLNESLNLMLVERGIEWLTYEDIDSIQSRSMVASNNTYKCMRALREIGHELVEGEEKTRVEEVKHGVETARKYIINSVKLVDEKDAILDNYYNSLVNVEIDDFYYYDYSYDWFDFNFVVCLYAGLYLFLALLYFLFWRSD